MKKILYNIIICFVTGTAVVAVLALLAFFHNNKKNGFIREINSGFVRSIRENDLQFNSFYIAGLTQHTIFLGNYVVRSQLLKMDVNLSNEQIRPFKNIVSIRLAWPMSTISVDSPNVYLYEGKTPSVYQAQYTDLECIPQKTPQKSFAAMVRISDQSSIIRIFDRKFQQYILIKDGDSSESVPTQPNLEKQGDGIFSDNGTLSYDKSHGSLFYTYFYRNEFIRFDTDLHVLYRANTIDTTFHAKLKVGAVTIDHQLSLANPSYYVSKRCCTAGNLLLIQSGLIADNESPGNFARTSVIDVYKQKTGAYLFSFYLPAKLTSFAVQDSTLVTVYDHYIGTYRLSFLPVEGSISR